MHSTSWSLLVAAGVGLLILTAQHLAVRWFRRRPLASGARLRLSVLKPLCGVDEGLEESLEQFAAMTGPEVELLLGVKDCDDPAFPLARRIAARSWPGVVRVVLQAGAPVMNPKVNQLITLARAARFELLMVSDSNARVQPEALDEVRALFAPADVACVANPVSGWGHRSFGALLDNLHLAAGIGPGQVAAKLLVSRDLVIGKSMTLRRSALDAMGGFGAFGDYAAEDFAIGQAVRWSGQRTVLARHPVWNVAVDRTLRSFFDRYRRWAVLQRTGVTLPMSLAHGLVNPWPLTVIATLLTPTTQTVVASAAVLVLKAWLDRSSAALLQLEPPRWWVLLPTIVVKDALLFVAWVEALFRRSIVWRGTRLVVEPGGRLVRQRLSGAAVEAAR